MVAGCAVRLEFSVKTKLQAYDRSLKPNQNGDLKPHCEICGKLILGLPEYDHIKAAGLGGDNSLENCQVACGACHRTKTHEQDRPIMQKADNQNKAQKNVKRKHKWPKRKFGQ